MKSINLENEMSANFYEYAISTITDRAIPDCRDGLKPVQKRILYCGYDEGMASNKPQVKCASLVGNCIAKWHPHGDASVYDALVRLSRPWEMRYPLLDFHGNNGSISGDPPAAYRYTETRLNKISEAGFFENIKWDVVDTTPNFDEHLQEPVVLPSIFPNLLCNPIVGIAVGYATGWAPHNLREVAAAIYDYMDGKEPEIPGPDFPLGGQVINAKECKNIIKKGKGSVKIRARYEIKGNTITFIDLPYGVTVEKILEEIFALNDEDKLIDGIIDARDESDKHGVKIVIECDKKADFKRIITFLYAKTKLQSNFSYNQVALVNGKPELLTLKDAIKCYLDHNIDCLTREFNNKLTKDKNRLNIVTGLLKALEDIDNVIKVIKASENSSAACVALQKAYGLNEAQAKAIVDMKLGRLANMEKIELETEAKELEEDINYLSSVLGSQEEQYKIIKERLQNIVDKFGDDRRTELTDVVEEKLAKIKPEVKPENCVVSITASGLIKRVASASFRTQKKGGKGAKSKDDIITDIIKTNTLDSLMVFTDAGTMYKLDVSDIPEGGKIVPIRSLVSIDPKEEPVLIYSIHHDSTAKYLLCVTKSGIVKKTAIGEYTKTVRKTGIPVIKLREGDALAAIALINDEELILASKNGHAIRFSSAEVGASGRTTMGVKGINIGADDEVKALAVIRDNSDDLGVFTASGLGKRISLSELPVQKRGGKGVTISKTELTNVVMINDSDNVLLVGATGSICIEAKEIPVATRTSQGNVLIKGTTLTGVSKT